MAQREQQAVHQVEAPDVAAAHPLRAALVEAASAGGISRAAMAGQINALLREMKPGPGAQADAAVITEALENGSLAGLHEAGAYCRVEAVAALLRLGYPWALGVHPGDLEFYRAELRAWPRWAKVAIGAALALLLAAGAGATFRATRPVQLAPVSLPLGSDAHPRHAAIDHPERAPRELVAGNTTAGSHAVAYRTSDGSVAAQIKLHAWATDPTTPPQLKVRAFGLYDDETGALVQSFPAELAPGTPNTSGEKSFLIDLPLPPELTHEHGRYFFVLDTSVNQMPYRAQRTDVISLSGLGAETFETDVPPLRQRLTVPVPVNPVRLLITVDPAGEVAQTVRLKADGPQGEEVVRAVETTKFTPIVRDGEAIGATFVFQYPSPVTVQEAEQPVVEDQTAPLDDFRLGELKREKFEERLESIRLLMTKDARLKVRFETEFRQVKRHVDAASTLRQISFADDELQDLESRFFGLRRVVR